MPTAIKDNIIKVDEPWRDWSKIYCPTTGKEVELQHKPIERFKLGQVRKFIMKCKFPCSCENQCCYKNAELLWNL